VGKTSGASTAVDAAVVPITQEAKASFAALSAALTMELRSAAGTAFTSILARISENAMKLALIVAVGRNPGRPVIEDGDAEWAIRFVRHFAGRTMEAVDRHVADTEAESHVKRLREIIRAAGRDGLTKSELTRASQWLKARDRDDTLVTLIESGTVKTKMRGSTTKKAMVFVALEEEPIRILQSP
jgi:hypothetical protein